MAAVVVDTHSAVWYFLESPRLSPDGLAAIEDAVQDGDRVHVPAISLVEIIYLVEKGRLPEVALERLGSALADPDSSFVVAPLDLGVAQAVRSIPREAVPEMPDRIIAATALHLGQPLVTRDVLIRATSVPTIW